MQRGTSVTWRRDRVDASASRGGDSGSDDSGWSFRRVERMPGTARAPSEIDPAPSAQPARTSCRGHMAKLGFPWTLLLEISTTFGPVSGSPAASAAEHRRIQYACSMPDTALRILHVEYCMLLAPCMLNPMPSRIHSAHRWQSDRASCSCICPSRDSSRGCHEVVITIPTSGTDAPLALVTATACYDRHPVH